MEEHGKSQHVWPPKGAKKIRLRVIGGPIPPEIPELSPRYEATPGAEEDVLVESDSVTKRAKERAEANSVEHLMTHFPKNRFCPACQSVSMQNVQVRRKKGKGFAA